MNRKVNWRSLDDLIATVDNAGLVTAVAPGRVTLEGRSGGASGTSEITGLEPDPCRGIEVTFEDANLEAAVREREDIPDTGPITGEMAKAATGTLDIQNRQIASLEGLQCFTGVNQIWGSTNAIADLTPIAGLVGLEELQLANNPILDLTPLSGLTALRSLILQGPALNGIDLAPVGQMTSLENLYIRDTEIPDLSFFGGLSNLRILNLHGTAIDDVSPLAALTGLVDLRLGYGTTSIQSTRLQAEAGKDEVEEIVPFGLTTYTYPIGRGLGDLIECGWRRVRLVKWDQRK